MRPPLSAATGWLRLIVRERSKTTAEGGEVDLERMLNIVGAQLEALSHLTEGLWLVHTAGNLERAVDGAVTFYNAPAQVYIAPDCRNMDTGCHSLGVILTLLLTSFHTSGRSVPFLTATRADDGYEILISPGPHERGDMLPDVTAAACEEQGWFSKIQVELMRSGHALTVRAGDSLVVFIIRASRG